MTYKKCQLYFKNHDPNIRALIPKILGWLENRQIEAEIFDAGASCPQNSNPGILIICLGGDGTLLGAGRMTAGKRIPLLGINCGHVGYLCAATPDNWEKELSRVLAGKEPSFYVGLNWTLLQGYEILATGCAVNDLVIRHGSLARMISLNVKINDRAFAPLRGDGLICYTPLGSSGYNLSAGGPLLAPELKNIGLTPICPYTLSFHPLVAPGNSVIEISADENRFPVYATIDGQEGFEMKKGTRLKIGALEDAVCLTGLNPGFSMASSARSFPQ